MIWKTLVLVSIYDEISINSIYQSFWKAREKYDIVFVDASFCQDNLDNYLTRTSKAKEVLKVLEDIAIDHRIPVIITLSHPSESSDKGKPTMYYFR